MSEPPVPTEVFGRAPQVGDVVGAYQVIRPLGAGGKAAVYLARREDGEEVALKVLHPSSLDNEDYKRFEREYAALEAMDHPHVVRVVDAGRAGAYPWLALEYVDGSDLGSLIEQWEANPPPDRFEHVERILRGLCLGLQYVHDQGLIHRDLKPSNVLVTRSGVPKITDFGVVKDPHAVGTQLTVAGRLVGTVAFMAPEQITGERVDTRADLYALGAVLYMMLTFTRPIEASSVAGYLARHLTEVPKSPGELDPSVPRRLEHICQRLLMKDPPQRYPSARAVLEALSREEGLDAAPLRGREGELNAWSQRLTALEDGAGGTVAVVGPPGSGRSHALRAMVEEARTRGIAVAHSGGWSPDPLRELVERAGGTAEPVPAPEQGEILAGLVVGRPVVLAMDDLDAAEREVTTTLGRLLRQRVVYEAQPVLLVYTTDSEDELSALARGFPSGIPCDILPLSPLDRMTTVAMVRDRGVLGAAAPILGRRLHAELGGQPGAVVQYLATLEAEGWLERKGHNLRATRPLDDFRRTPLPVPTKIREALELRLEGLDEAALELCTLLALVDRPAGAPLLARCASEPSEVPRVLDTLVQGGLLVRTEDQSQEILTFADASTGTVLKSRLGSGERVQLHGCIARALAGRRRRSSASLEVAHHLVEAGEVAQAAPIFLAAARKAARAGRWTEVQETDARLSAVADALPATHEAHLWLPLLRGEALMARGSWAEAVRPLEVAAAFPEPSGPEVRARLLTGLGRAWHRQGALDRARPLLREAVELAGPDHPHRASALRSLADIAMASGDLTRSEALWTEALDLARDADEEARSHRGMAHLRAMQGQMLLSNQLLERAEELLGPEGSPRVRAGILARRIELDLAAGRFAAALYRCDALLDLVHTRELSERLPEVLALTAESQWAAGLDAEALQTNRHALTYARAGEGAWDARLRAARLLCEAGRWEEVDAALPESATLPQGRIGDPAAQFAVLRAWRVAETHPVQARDLATWALVRPRPLLVTRFARIARDATLALVRAGQLEHARTAAKTGLRALEAPGTDGSRLELLLALHRALPDPRVLTAAGQLAHRVWRALPRPVAADFKQRDGVGAALATIR